MGILVGRDPACHRFILPKETNIEFPLTVSCSFCFLSGFSSKNDHIHLHNRRVDGLMIVSPVEGVQIHDSWRS